jgi:hypothetical protein
MRCRVGPCSSLVQSTGQPRGDHGDARAVGAEGAGGADVWAAGLAWLQRQADIAEQLIRARGQAPPVP